MIRIGRTASGAIANLAAQGVPFLLLLIVTPILLRSLGSERYGALVLFNLVPQIAGQLDLGVSTAATRGFAQYHARADHGAAMRLFREALLLLTAWGALLAVAFYVLHPQIAHALKLDTIVNDQSSIYLAAAVAIPLALANSGTLIALRAIESYGTAARIQIIVGSAYWISCTIWATHGGDLTQLVALGTFTVLLGTVALLTATRRTFAPANAQSIAGPMSREPDRPINPVPTPAPRFRLAPFLPLSTGSFVAQVSGLATYHADKLLISALISPAAAGAYAICTGIANKILLVVAAGATFTFPRSARLHAEGDLTAVAQTYRTATRFALLLATCAAAVMISAAPAFLKAWLGVSFASDYGWTLRLLALAYAIGASSVVASNVAIGIGEVVMPALFAVLSGASTLIAVALLAPTFGAAGAGAAALIGMTQALVFNDVVARRLGTEAREASWPLIWRLALIGTVACAAATAAGTLVDGWLSLAVLGTATASCFVGLWLCTFGRGKERHLLDAALARLRSGAPS